MSAQTFLSNAHCTEVLMDAYDSLLWAGDFLTTEDPRGWVRKSNVLLDACLDAGMSQDEADHVAWATFRVTDALVSA